VKRVDGKEVGIRYKFSEISKCQECLKYELFCPDGAIQPIKYEVWYFFFNVINFATFSKIKDRE